MRLVLASASPRRRELLQQAGIAFEARAAGVDETYRTSESPVHYVERLALEKARVVSALSDARGEPQIVLGADTTVVLDGEILNKPANRSDAERTLRKLSARTHHVHTGIALVCSAGELTHVETTDVTFHRIPEPELTTYLASGDPLDKAGSYGIQGYAARWIPRIAGDYFNVVGLPIAAVVQMLNECEERFAFQRD